MSIIDKLFNLLPVVFTEKLIKSFSRYVLAGLIAILAPVAFPGIAELVGFLQQNLNELAEILTLILAGVLAVWTVAKNKANAKLEKLIGSKIR